MTLRLFVDVPLQAAARLALPPGAARHVQVRRMQPGETLVLFDGRGGEWTATVTSMGRNEVLVQIDGFSEVDRELPWAVTLAVGAPANERMDWLVEKAGELGVTAVQPLLCERSVLRLAGERIERKREHWQAVAVAACEQSGRTRVPMVAPMCALERWLAALPPSGERWLLSPAATAPLQRPARGSPLVVLSGPEGGLSSDEENAARAAGFHAVQLGPRILRAETAPIALLGWLGLGG